MCSTKGMCNKQYIGHRATGQTGLEASRLGVSRIRRCKAAACGRDSTVSNRGRGQYTYSLRERCKTPLSAVPSRTANILASALNRAIQQRRLAYILFSFGYRLGFGSAAASGAQVGLGALVTFADLLRRCSSCSCWVPKICCSSRLREVSLPFPSLAQPCPCSVSYVGATVPGQPGQRCLRALLR